MFTWRGAKYHREAEQERVCSLALPGIDWGKLKPRLNDIW